VLTFTALAAGGLELVRELRDSRRHRARGKRAALAADADSRTGETRSEGTSA
jgi:hypothetical protein